MKIDQTKVKRGTSEVQPADCKALIEKLRLCLGNDEVLIGELKQIRSWTFGKCELFHWTEVLDMFDAILERAGKKDSDKKWLLPVDLPENKQMKELLISVLYFTALLIEHSFSRHLYNSMEHLTTLMSSSDMQVVLAVLNLLYVFSKRSNFITRMALDRRQALVLRLTHLAESWGGKENGFGLADCCRNQTVSSFPPSATTLHFEFYAEQQSDDKQGKKNVSNVLSCIHIEALDKVQKLPAQIMEDLLEAFHIPNDKRMFLFTHVRLAHSFSDYEKRIHCVQARLQAISILVYSNAIQENINALLYNGLIEELVDILEIKAADDNILGSRFLPEVNEPKLMEIKAASLRTLTSIIHLERNPKLNAIIDATGAASYHGFLPILVRNCIQHMCDGRLDPFPQPFATALFSFLYHLASYESGGEALESCGMMEALLRVINWYSDGQEHITFVTRAVRVIDLITNLDMAAFQTHGGLTAFINRLELEVDICRQEQPFVIKPARSESTLGMDSNPASPASPPVITEQPMETEQTIAAKNDVNQPTPSTSDASPDYSAAKTGLSCFPQRAALLKSMLNFLKKAIPDPAFSESIRHLMDGSLPRSLKHIISNAEYYGPSLFLLATDVVTVYVFQEPSLLSSLQDNGLTDVVLHALLIKDVPATREVLASLPNVFSALCLNARGLGAFVQCKPFERLFKVLLSPDYLPAMRRRRSSNPLGDTASNLGNAMDELMRHQPSLRTDATRAIIKLLEEVAAMGENPKFVCQKPPPKNDGGSNSSSMRSPTPNEVSSDEDEDEDDIPPPPAVSTSATTSACQVSTSAAGDDDGGQSEDRIPIPLMDYVLNVMKFVEAILSNNTTDDHCREFVSQTGLEKLMKILGLPNLPIDFPVSPSCQAVGTVCKAIFTLSREPQVLKEGLFQLNGILLSLEPLHKPLEAPGGSVLLRELVNAPCCGEGPMLSYSSTPLLHALSAAHAYITMFVYVCRVGQTDIRSISVSHWGSDLGLQVLKGLSQLYTSLVWESTVLLALCSEDILPPGCEFGKADMDKLLPKECGAKDSLTHSNGDLGSNGVSAAMESLTTQEANSPMPVDIDEVVDDKKIKLSPALQAQIKQIKPLLSASSRLGRALAELFGLLVKLCVGSPVRQRSRQQLVPQPIARTPAARAVASALTKLLANGLSWTPPPTSPVPKLRLTFYICSVGFTSPMLFDESKFAFHLMLQNFVTSGGQDALFESFNWALSCGGQVALMDGLENPDLPDGSGEFLDAWLMLVEKMVNTRNILESQHTVPEKPSSAASPAFSPLHYLIKTHKAAFHAIMSLWDKKPLKVYGSRMSECILAILCHIIRGETIIADMLKKKEKEQTPVSATGTLTSNATRPDPDELLVNQEQLQQLMDMGFGREHCIAALLHNTSIEQATEYLLTHPLAASSLTNSVLLDPTEAAATGEKKENEKVDEDPLAKSVLDDFFDNMMSGCLKLLDSLPETVYRICDLLLLVTQRNTSQWRDNVLEGLVNDIITLSRSLWMMAAPMQSGDDRSISEWATQLSSVPDAAKLATRLHLLSLLFEDLKMACATIVEKTGLMELLPNLLERCQQCLSLARDCPTPKWMAPLMLLIDQYCKVTLGSRRHAQVKQLLGNVRIWKWFDDRSGRWCTYSTSNNKTIDDAYSGGATSIRFTAGRRKYTVHFSTMVQVNEDTGNRRPIMLSLPTAEERENAKSTQNKKEKNEDKEEKMDIEDSTERQGQVSDLRSSSAPDNDVTATALSEDILTPGQLISLIRSCVGLVSIPVDADTLHAVMRLCLRITRDHQYALTFAQLDGVKLLLNLTQSSAFQGFTSLATLLIRHVLEDSVILRQLMEKVVRNPSSGNNTSLTGVAQSSIGAIELHYVMRLLSPAACRNPHLARDVMRDVFSVVVPQTIPGKNEDSRLVGPNAAQILKMSPLVTQKATQLDGLMREVVYELLNALTVKYTWLNEDAAVSASFEVKAAQTLAEAIQEVVNEVARETSDRHGLIRTDTSSAVDNSLLGCDESGKESPSTSKDTNGCGKFTDSEKKKRPLLPKSAIMRVLAELIKSYSCCANLIVQHTYPAQISELIPEECSVLAFILDQLLPQCQRAGDKDCPALARVLIASIAACNSCVDAQTQLVSEVKSALQRALVLAECSDKHSRIQALANIVGTMIESSSPGKNLIFKSQQVTMNNMVKLLVKKGAMTDLSRIPHALDLSSPYMPTTVNCALKPLEILSRIMNQPQTLMKKKETVGQKTTCDDSDRGTSTNGEASTDGGGTATCDNETEDIGAEAEDLTVVAGDDHHGDHDDTSDLQVIHNDDDLDEDREAQVLRQVEELEEVLDDLLGRDDSGRRTEDQVITDIILAASGESHTESQGEDIEDDTTDEEEHVVIEDDEGHDTQMVAQELSDDDVEQRHGSGPGPAPTGVRIHGRRRDDRSSASESADDDDEDEDDGDDGRDEEDEDEHEMDGQDEEEDEEEEDDDEGSDMEGDADDYGDMLDDESIFRRVNEDMRRMGDDNDLFLHLDDVMPPGVVFNDSAQLRAYQLPIAGHDNDNGNDALPSVPPAPSNVTSNHPLLVRHPDTSNPSGAMASRVHRHGFGRQRGTYRYNPTTQTLHVHYTAGNSRPPNPPAILQRLLGPDYLQLTNSLSSQGGSGTGAARVYVTDDPYVRMIRPDEDMFEDLFQDSYTDSVSGSSVLTNVPSALTRWTEEARVLDGDSAHDCVLLLKPEILGSLDKKREDELSVRREKQKKDDDEKKSKVLDKSGSDMEKDMDSMPSNLRHDESRDSLMSAAAASSRFTASALIEAIISSNASSTGGVTLATSSSPASAASAASAASTTSTSSTLLGTSNPASADSSPYAPLEGSTLSALIAETVAGSTGSAAGPITLDALSRAFAAVSAPPYIAPLPVLASSMTHTPRTSASSMTQSAPPTRPLFGTPLTTDIGHFFNLSAPMDSSSNSSSGPDPLTWAQLRPSANHNAVLLDTPTSLESRHGDTESMGDTAIYIPTNRPVELPDVTSDGVITPEEPSNDVTSSDAVTVHSTPSSGTGSEEPSLSTPGAAGPLTSSLLGELPRPEDVDPSFLAALPENIRQEVVNEQLRLQRIQQRAEQQNQLASQTESLGVTEVNPEFLAALPPAIQEEVLAQQRAEQARLAAASVPPILQAPDTANVDPTSFIATLPTSLRQQVLADMDDSMMAVLPPTLAAEAQTLRRELEDRHRRLMQERLFSQSGAASLSAILRNSGLSRFGTRSNFRGGSRPGHHWQWASQCRQGQNATSSQVHLRGRHLLDHEALTCLLVLLFVDEPKLNTNRLHRVLRNLCYHAPTRNWVFRALLSIVQRTSETRPQSETESRGKTSDKGKKKSSHLDLSYKADSMRTVQPAWLSISLDAALGCRANVFQIQRGASKRAQVQAASVIIHPQAAPVVCRHVLDTLISLAKSFPSHFAPSKNKSLAKKPGATPDVNIATSDNNSTSKKASHTSPARTSQSRQESDFWEQLIKLDQISSSKKGKCVQRAHSNPNLDPEPDTVTYETSPLGQLMMMLAHPVIRRSQLLTDRLLRLLGLVSIGLPDTGRSGAAAAGAASSLLTTGGGTTGGQSSLAATGTGSNSMSLFARIVSQRTGAGTGALHDQRRAAESMDTSSPDGAKKKKTGDDGDATDQEQEDDNPLLDSQLQLAVQVLTSKSCSEEGLEDATNLLLHLSKTSSATRNSVLNLLMAGATELGQTVCQHIGMLLSELQQIKTRSPDQDLDQDVADQEQLPTAMAQKGVLEDRFGAGNIVIHAPSKIKAGRELQLPSMVLLTNKASSQQFFLRILKVINQLRDAARGTVVTKHKRTDTLPFIDAESESEGSPRIRHASTRQTHSRPSADEQQQQQPPRAVEDEAGGAATDATAAADVTAAQRHSGADLTVTSQARVGEAAAVPMDTDVAGPSVVKPKPQEEVPTLPRLSILLGLDGLWDTLGECLTDLAKTPDHHAVLVLQPAVEAFFLVHAGETDSKKKKESTGVRKEDQLSHLNDDMLLTMSPAPSSSHDILGLLSRDNSMASVSSALVPPDTQKFLKFAETHRTVLNQILRQSTTPLADGPFSVLVDHTRVLDFDVKRRYFRQELQRCDEGMRREDLAVHVRREHVFEDAFRELFRRTPDEWKHRFYIIFEGEEGQDAGGLLREFYLIIAREIFNPHYALFSTSSGDRVTYTINPASHCNSNHLSYFKFVGRIIAKAIYDNKLLECYFTRSFYKHMLGVPVRYLDMEHEDYAFSQGLLFLLENDISHLGYELTFSTEIQEFGVNETRDLIQNGRNIAVTEDNKKDYVKLVCQMKMTGAIRKQLNSFLEGFYDIIPKRLISIFNEQELELLLSGLPTIDIDDLKANTEYHKYQQTSLQIQWFWRALRSFDQADRARFLQFVTGTSKVPLQGFSNLEGMNGVQKFQIHRDDRSTDRLPSAHTCFNQLDLPAYETFDKLKKMLLLAINECSEGFGLA